MSTPGDSHRTALMGLAVVTNRLLQKQKRPKELPWSETEHLIDEWIHSFIGTSRSGGCASFYSGDIRSYIA